jgi:hypothetical protein
MSNQDKPTPANRANSAKQEVGLAPLADLAGAADNTAKNSAIGKPFKKGQSGNPAGRPKGARNKLSEALLGKLLDDFNEHGEEAIERVRKSDPEGYLKILATLVAKVPTAEVNVNNNTLVSNNRVMIVTDHGTDEEWEAKLQIQQQALVDVAQ